MINNKVFDNDRIMSRLSIMQEMRNWNVETFNSETDLLNEKSRLETLKEENKNFSKSFYTDIDEKINSIDKEISTRKDLFEMYDYILKDTETLNESIAHSIKWRVAKYSIKFLPESKLDEVLERKDINTVNISKKEKIELVQKLMSTLSEDEKEDIVDSPEVSKAIKRGAGNAVTGAVITTSGLIGVGGIAILLGPVAGLCLATLLASVAVGRKASKEGKEDLSKAAEKATSLTESILDPVQKYHMEAVFGPNKSEDTPMITDDLRKFILNIVNEFTKAVGNDCKATEVFMVGSSLGFQYRETSDIDVDVRINKSTDEMQGKYSLVPKGIVYPGTQHPVNVFLLTSDAPEYNFAEDCENAYDILENKWIKFTRVSNSDPIPYPYVSGISEFLMDGITLEIQRAERDLRDINKYLSLDPSKVEISEKERDEAISQVINDLIIDKDALELAHRMVFRLDQDGFKNDNIKISINYKSDDKRYSMNNLIYKYIDSFGYYDKIRDIIKEIDNAIKVAKQDIKADNSAEGTPEAENKKEIEKTLTEENYYLIESSRLPSDPNQDPEFGIPQQKKYPLFDKRHVISAIKLFGHVDAQYEVQLARNIIAKMKKYDIPYDMVGEDNPLYKYIPETFRQKEED